MKARSYYLIAALFFALLAASAVWAQSGNEGLDSLMCQMGGADRPDAAPAMTTRSASFAPASGSGNAALDALWDRVEATSPRTRSAGGGSVGNRITTRNTAAGIPVATFMLMPGGLSAPGTAKGDGAAAAARAFLENTEVAMAIGAGVKGVASPAQFVQDGEFPGEWTTVPFYQAIDGIPIFASRAVVSVNRENQVTAFNGNLVELEAAGSLKGGFGAPKLNEAAARKAADKHFKKQKRDLGGADAHHIRPFYFSAQAARCEGDAGLCRAWQVYGPESYVLVCASTGDILFEETVVIEAAPRIVYDARNNAINDCDGGVSPARREGGAATGNAEVDQLYEILGQTRDFFATTHGHHGFDGAGMAAEGLARVCRVGMGCPMQNAFWHGNCMKVYFGEGMATTDIVAHEYTHGVTHFMSRLIYRVEETRIDGRRYENVSGAVNESFSDIWGEFVDLTSNPNKQADQRWLMGDGAVSGPIRNMAHPPQLQNPDRRYSTHYKEVTGPPTGANGLNGVHAKSTVLGKLCYLLTDGANFNGRRISGMGIPRVAALFWEVQKQFATASGAGGGTVCSFAEVYEALLRGANALGFSAEELSNLEQACRAVEIGGLPMPVSDLTAQADGNGIMLRWKNPETASFQHPVIAHDPNNWPDDPAAGEIVRAGERSVSGAFSLKKGRRGNQIAVSLWAFHGQDAFGVPYYSAPVRCVLDAGTGKIEHLYEAPVFAASTAPQPEPAPSPPPAPTPTPDPSPPSSSGRHAVVVGVNIYANPAANLRGCEGDAQRFRQLLIDYFGFRENDITLLLSRDATAANIMSALEERLIRASKPGDQLVFFFSGHGDRIRDLDGDEADGFDEVLCPTDTQRRGDTLVNVVVDDQLHELFSRAQDRHISVFLDACHSGTMLRGMGEDRIKWYSQSDRTLQREEALATRGPTAPRSSSVVGAGDAFKSVRNNEVLAAATSADSVAFEKELEIDGLIVPAGMFTTFIQTQIRQTSGRLTWQDLHSALTTTDFFPAQQQPHVQANAGMMGRFVLGDASGGGSPTPPPPPPTPSNLELAPLSVYVADMNEVTPGSRTGGDARARDRLRTVLGGVPCVALVGARAQAQVTVYCGEASGGGFVVVVLLPGRYGERRFSAADITETHLAPFIQTLREQYLVRNLRDIRTNRSNMDLRVHLHNHAGLEVREGSRVELRIESDLDGHLMLFSVGAGGEFLPYIPSDSFPGCVPIRAGQPYLFPGQGLYIQMEPPLGTEYIKAILWRECPNIPGLDEFYTDLPNGATAGGAQNIEAIIKEIKLRSAPLRRERDGQQQQPLLADADLTYTSVPR